MATTRLLSPRARILLIGALTEEAEALRENLATATIEVDLVTAPGDRPGVPVLARVLGETLDLILVWEREEGDEVRALFARQRSAPWRTPVVAVVEEGMESRGLSAVVAGAEGFVVGGRWQSVAALLMRYERERFRRQLPELARSIYHDLRSSQATIPLATHLLADRLEDPRDGEVLAAIDNATARSAELVGALYALALDACGEGTRGSARASLGHVLDAAARRLRSVSRQLVVELAVVGDASLAVLEPGEVVRVIVGLGLVATEAAAPGTVLYLEGRSGERPEEVEVILAASRRGGDPPAGGCPAIPPAFALLVEKLRGHLDDAVSTANGEGYRLRLPAS